MDMEQEYYSAISSELHKETCIQVERDKKKMIKHFNVLRYEQFVLNWFILFMKIRNHNNIVDKYLRYIAPFCSQTNIIVYNYS